MSPLVKTLVESLGRHKPRYLTEEQTCAVIRRLIKHARPGERGCCLWGGAVNNCHYGKITVRVNGVHRNLYVHKLAYEMSHDPAELPFWMEVSHKCDTPPCYHPDCVSAERRKQNRQRSADNTNRKRELAALREAA